MKINNFFYLLMLISFIIYSRGGRGGGRNGSFGHSGRGGGRNGNFSHSRNGGRGVARNLGSKHRSSKHSTGYSHGGGNSNHYGNHYGGGGFNAAGWGLGGMGMGLLLGASLNNGGNGGSNVTIINSYDDKKTNTTKKESTNDYNSIVDNLKLKITDIENLSKKIDTETEKINNNKTSHYIDINFSPSNKLKIIKKTSNELYGDLSKQQIEVVSFDGNQPIENIINLIRANIKSNLEKLITLTYKDNQETLQEIKLHLINALKILNANLVTTVRVLQK